MYNFNFIEHTADIAVDLEADSLEELFICAAEAWNSAMCEDCNISANDSKKIELSADTREELLVDFLSEINYFFLTKKWFTVSVSSLTLKENNAVELSAAINGQDISSSDIEFDEEIKAVTYHQLKIKKESGKFSTRIVFDI